MVLSSKIIIELLLYPAIAILTSLILTKLSIHLLPIFGMLDHPGDRHIHQKPIPRGGGIAIIIAFFISSSFFLFHGVDKYSIDIYKILLPALILILGGIIDDKFNIRPRYKLILQIIVATICWFNGITFHSFLAFVLPAPISLLITVIWIVALINAFNLVDGIDGLAAGLGVIACLCMGIIFILNKSIIDAIPILCIGAACLGFLYYNFHPAKIFMGDTGSMFIGFMLAIISIELSYKTATLSAVIIPLLACGLPLFDSFLAIWRRFARKILFKFGFKHKNNHNIMSGDQDHIHHRILKKSSSQSKTTLILYSVSIFFSFLAILLVIVEEHTQGIVLIIILIASISIIRRLANIEIYDSKQILLAGIYKIRKNVLISLLNPFIDIVLIIIASLFVQFIFCSQCSNITQFMIYMYKNSFFTIFPIILTLHFTQIYKIHWFRLSFHDIFYLLQMIFIGTFIGFILAFFSLEIINIKLFIAKYILYYFLISTFIIFERLFLLHLKYALLNNTYFLKHRDKQPTKILYSNYFKILVLFFQNDH